MTRQGLRDPGDRIFFIGGEAGLVLEKISAGEAGVSYDRGTVFPAVFPDSLMTTRQRPVPSGATFDVAFWGVSLCFLLSGIAGLVYQVVWMRYLSTVFGTSEVAIVTVLVAYMGGLAVGAALASRQAHRLVRPIRTYAILECVIALSAVLVPLLLKGVAALHAMLLGGQSAPPPDGGLGEALAFLGLGCLVLLIPTACMGATLPILAAGIVRREEQIGKRVGWLYALNTFGAVAGTLLAAFVFIPRLGLWQTSFIGVALNLTVAVLGWFVALRVPRVSDGEAVEDEEVVSAGEKDEKNLTGMPSGISATLILVVMLFSGAVSFVYEILWSRLLAHVVGGSLVAFATMLAAFLGGIAIGGLLGARFAGQQRRSCYWLAGVEIAAGLITLLLFLHLSSSGFADKRWGEATTGSLANLCIWLLLPATICIGATFPLAVRALTRDPGQAGRMAGRVYSCNTVGAIFGAVGAGYVLVPELGYGSSFKWAIVVNLLLGALILIFMKPRPSIPAAAAAVLVLVTGAFYHPGPPLELLTLSPGVSRSGGGKTPVLIHHAVGHSASVAVLERQGSFLLNTNGLREAEVFPRGAGKLSYTSIRWLPALPVVLRPESRSMLVVGFGGGALLEAVPRSVESIDVVELEAEVIRANQFIADRRAIDPFQDERIKVIVNDVRGALRLTDKRYDTIVSQPSHPWTAGASHLYTREFLDLVRDHLEEEGTFVQWLGAQFVDENLLRSFCATMLAVFPHTQLYLISDNFVFVGSRKSLEDPFLPGATPEGGLFRFSDYPKLANREDVLAKLQLDEAGCRRLAAGHAVVTDDRNLMATGQKLDGKREGAMNGHGRLREVLSPLHFLNQESSKLLDGITGGAIDRDYLDRLLRGSARHIDLTAYRARKLSRDDQRPARVRAVDVSRRLELGRRGWKARGRGAGPRELAELLAEDETLAGEFGKLSDRQRSLLEAEHWMLTGQLQRARKLPPQAYLLEDHRDPLYVTAAEIRLRCLMDVAGKSVAEQESDAHKGADLLDHLLSLTLVSNLTLTTRRIELAHRLEDTDYLRAMGWILARRLATAPAGAPEQMKDLYRAPLGAILEPYASRDPQGRLRLSNKAIDEWYREARSQMGDGIFPVDYRRK